MMLLTYQEGVEKFITDIMRPPREETVFLNRTENGLREQGEKSSLKLLCWFGDGTRMSIYTHGLNLSLAAKVRVKHLGFFFFFLISLPRCGTKRQKGG